MFNYCNYLQTAISHNKYSIHATSDGYLYWTFTNAINRVEITRDVNTTNDITSVPVDTFLFDLWIGYVEEAAEESGDTIKTYGLIYYLLDQLSDKLK